MLPSLLSSSAKVIKSIVQILSLLPYLLLTLYPQEYHFCPHICLCLPKHHWHKSPKTSQLSKPVDTSWSSFRTSLLHRTLLAINSLLFWAFLSCSLPWNVSSHASVSGFSSAHPLVPWFQPLQANLTHLVVLATTCILTCFILASP